MGFLCDFGVFKHDFRTKDKIVRAAPVLAGIKKDERDDEIHACGEKP